jgi:hypothetical protein
MVFDWTVFGVGVLGGALAELLKWYLLRESENPPAYLRSGFYWVITALMALAGGVLAIIQKIETSNILLALNIGISAPMILKGLAAAIPIQPPKGTSFAAKTGSAKVLDMIAGRKD